MYAVALLVLCSQACTHTHKTVAEHVTQVTVRMDFCKLQCNGTPAQASKAYSLVHMLSHKGGKCTLFCS
jgi:hypothetical protein